jgi:hypothetical protein
MAKVTTTSLIAGLSGKVCQHDDTYFVTNRQTGRVHTGRICHPSEVRPSEAQISQREKFAQRCANTNQWIKSNCPSVVHPKGTEIYQKALKAYKAQHKIGTFYGFIANRIKEDGSVTIGGMTGGSNGSGDMG